ncbi:MAG: TetR/AcrR family transcriptional regulator [Rhodothermia bacterium]|nr:TetR/AcrR family transcriptional regulator [Rhodothermia bacterium]
MQIAEETKAPSRREREKEARRRAMLEAAQAVFAERGYANATLDEIAARAEFGKGTLYNYFAGGKEEILFALLDQLYDGIIEIIDSHFSIAAVKTDDIRSVVVRFLDHTFAFLAEQDDLFLIAIKEAHRYIFGDDPEKTEYFRRQRDRIVDALVPPIEAAMDAGVLKPLSATAVAHMLLGNINGCYTHVCLCNRFGSPEETAPYSASENAEFIATMLFDGLAVRDKN